MAEYEFAIIEEKWQQYWQDNGTFHQPGPGNDGFIDKPKKYVLDMFPYPSGAGLHVGHPEGYTATDIVCRHARMKGYNVLHPMGYDSFGLPAEQYAVEHGVHPRETTASNIANIERQIKKFGFSYDWTRRIVTSEPSYYRWTQWIFLQLFNSWYDPQANAARPIEALVKKLESGELVVDVNCNLTVPPVTETIEAVAGVPSGFYKFTELEADQQQRLIDDYRLAYMAEAPVNWCPKLGTVLANEEVTNEGRSERGDYPVYRRAMKQWMLRITAYADRLLTGLDDLDWPESIKIMQRNWIGKSTGAEVIFDIAGHDELELEVYTTRPDTLFGATYIVLAPEHPLVEEITTDGQKQAVNHYVETAVHKSELERTADTKQKTGVFTGTVAVNPVNNEEIPIWVADYVMMGYGTGAIMAVPAHDTRDLEFAEQFSLPVVQVVAPPDGQDWRGYVGEGVAINSGQYDGMATSEFKKTITEWLETNDCGRQAVNYKLRDWLFSRQRYWGEPFPIIHCHKCGPVALEGKDLPLLLPEMDDFTPAASDDPEAPPAPPLGKMTDWTKTTCPICGKEATRELNTMPQWAGSSWYHLRFCDPTNTGQFCHPETDKYWMTNSKLADGSANKGQPKSDGVDLYVGGAEHAVLHLLYSRFWHKVLYDLGWVSSREPFGKLFNQGMIRSFAYRDKRGVYIGYDDVDLTGDAPVHRTTGETLTESIEKMSKSLKNVVNPEEVIAKYGADTFRIYEMFMGPLEASKPWNTRDVPGSHRFCHRVWRMILGDADNAVAPLLTDATRNEVVEKALHKLIKKVGQDIEAMKFNTAIAAMMEFVNVVFKAGEINTSQAERFVLVLSPFAPHICEELWQRMGHKETLAYEPWPTYTEDMITEDTAELVIQINGKIRGRISMPAEADRDEILEAVLADSAVTAAVADKTIIKTIVVPKRLVNLVVK